MLCKDLIVAYYETLFRKLDFLIIDGEGILSQQIRRFFDEKADWFVACISGVTILQAHHLQSDVPTLCPCPNEHIT